MRIEPLLEGEKLSLTTPGHLEVFFLGTGGAFSQSLGNTNLLLIQGETHLLVDFGITGPARLWEKARLLPTDIQAILPTHVHSDHVGGLENLAFQHYFIAKKKPLMFVTEALQKDLWDDTLAGGMKYLTGVDHPLRLGDYFIVKMPSQTRLWPDEQHEFTYGPMKVKLFSTDHIAVPYDEPQFRSYGLCVNDRVFFSGDSLFDPNTIRRFPSCETFFHDCSIRPAGDTHATLAELRTGILNARTKKNMFLVHYSDDYKSCDVSDFAGWAESGVRYIFD
jgi:hydroxyacylglutathione hydrolase